MARLIDADALIAWIKGSQQMTSKMKCVIAKIETMPDAVSVVRCKECKWAKANGTYQWCGRLDSTARITADDFCSYGERKEGE